MDPIGKSPVATPVLLTVKVAMAACWFFPLYADAIPGGPLYRSEALGMVGMALYAIGIGLAIGSFVSLGRSLSVGLPETATELKTGGVYGLSRNPMYLAAYIVCAGSFCMAAHPLNLALVLVTIGVHHRIILAEERFLTGRFGGAYEEYSRRTPRYL